MRRALLLGCIVVTGCNGILGIESASFTPVPPDTDVQRDGGSTTVPDAAPVQDASIADGAAEAEAAAPDAGGDAGSCTTTPLTDARNCGACGHDCAGGVCADGKCQPYVVVSDTNASYASLVMDDTNLYFTDANSATLNQTAIGGGGSVEPLFTNDRTLGIPKDLVLFGGFIYFLEISSGTTDSGIVARCPVATGCPADGAEDMVSQLDSPLAFAVEPTSGAIVVGTAGADGDVVLCQSPPCINAEYTRPIQHQTNINQVGIVGTTIAWSTSGPFATGLGQMAVLTTDGTRVIQTASGIFDFTLTADHVFYGTPSTLIEAATFDGQKSPLGSSQSITNIATDGTNVYWTDFANGIVWQGSLAAGTQGTQFASHQAGPVYVTADKKSVAWSNGSSILRVVK